MAALQLCGQRFQEAPNFSTLVSSLITVTLFLSPFPPHSDPPPLIAYAARDRASSPLASACKARASSCAAHRSPMALTQISSPRYRGSQRTRGRRVPRHGRARHNLPRGAVLQCAGQGARSGGCSVEHFRQALKPEGARVCPAAGCRLHVKRRRWRSVSR